MAAAQNSGAESGETRDYVAPISPGSPLGTGFDSSSLFNHTVFMPPANFDAPELSRPQRARHSRKQPDGHIPRPPNAFILFRSSFIRSQRVSTEVETSHSTLSKIIGLTWQNLPEDERRVWHAKAREAGEEHRRKFPTYAFRPAHRRASPGGGGGDKDARRKVREHGVDDPRRCEKIAELLVEGKHGSELDAAVHEFDRHRVAPVVARFEPPVTATTYRRSSSAPAPDTEPSMAFLYSAPALVAQRRRSSSSGPPCRAAVESSPTVCEDPNITENASGNCAAVGSFASPWTLDPEPDYFDFSSFSFAPAGPPSPSITCDPLSMLSNTLSPAPDFNFSESQEYETNIGAFIAEDWARAIEAAPGAAHPGLGYDAPAPAYFHVAQQPYIAAPHPHPALTDAELAQLMREYSLDT
ncbi:hypothetical protein DFH09DRAFT_1374365 [Mycena vulgaris]|nr:hypothetical protein DFH09DRAFT_1374365 [Mycena vulgaris]